MTERVFDRETLLDLSINIVPIGTILFFIALLIVFDPFRNNIVAVLLSQGLLVISLVILAAVTYLSGRIIAEAEHTGSSETAATITRIIIGEVATDESGKDDKN